MVAAPRRRVIRMNGPMIRIAVSAEAFEAVAATLPLGSNIFFQRETTPKGERIWIWIERLWLNKLAAMRGPGEFYSDVILWLVEIEAREVQAG